MDTIWMQLLIVCPFVFLAGFVDSIAGGGGLISLPAYVIAGVPVHNAIACNKLSSAAGTVISTARYLRNKFADMKMALPTVLAAMIGSPLGAAIALRTSDKILQICLMVICPVVAFYVLKKKNLEPDHPFCLPWKKQCAIATVASFVIGVYDGFYGPGTGTFLLLVFTSVAKMDVRTASGNLKIVNLTSNIAALVTFIMAGKILWILSLTAAVFSIAGHYVGAGMVMKKGTNVVKPIILVVMVLLFVKIISELIV